VPFPLRAEKAVLNAVKRCAAADLRSVNAQIEVLLREALERRGISIWSTDGDAADRQGRRDPTPGARN